MDLYLHHEQGTPAALQQCHGSKKRTHECREEKAAESWARLQKDYSRRLLNRAVIQQNCNVICALQNHHKFTVKTAVDTCVLNVHKSYTLI